jgi:hypothetical protein
MTIVGRTCCSIAPKTLNMSPASHITKNDKDRPSPDRRRKFSIICGEKTTSQHAIEMLPVIPDIVSAENCGPFIGGGIGGCGGKTPYTISCRVSCMLISAVEIGISRLNNIYISSINK